MDQYESIEELHWPTIIEEKDYQKGSLAAIINSVKYKTTKNHN